MSIVWLEGFETDNTASEYAYKYFGGDPEKTPASHPAGRFGGRCARGEDTPNDFQVHAVNVGVHNTLVTGIAVRADLPKDGDTLLCFVGQGQNALQITQHAADFGKHEFAFRNKGIELYRTNPIDPHVWVYLEAWMRFDPPGQNSGINTVFRVNGMDVYARSVDNGVTNGIPGYSEFYIRGEARALSGGYVDVDDFYIFDHTQDGPHYMLWDSPNVAIQTLHPSDNGNNTEWTPVGAAENHEAIDDSPGLDLDSTYVIGDSETDLDMYKIDEVTYLRDQIYGLGLEWDARADDGEGSANVEFLFQSGTSDPKEVHSQPTITFSEANGRAIFRDPRNPATGQFLRFEDFQECQIGFGAKENWVSLASEDDDQGGGDQELNLDYGTASTPTGTPLDYGSASNPTGPALDLGDANND